MIITTYFPASSTSYLIILSMKSNWIIIHRYLAMNCLSVEFEIDHKMTVVLTINRALVPLGRARSLTPPWRKKIPELEGKSGSMLGTRRPKRRTCVHRQRREIPRHKAPNSLTFSEQQESPVEPRSSTNKKQCGSEN